MNCQPKRNLIKIIVAALAIVSILIMITVGATGSRSSAVITFRVCLGTILSTFGCAQLYVATVFYLNRKHALLELSQPIGLSIFVVSASVATMGSFLFALPEYDFSCALRQPTIITSISLMGSILAARSWRIGLVLLPMSMLETGPSAKHSSTLRGWASKSIAVSRCKAILALCTVSECFLVFGSCGKYKPKRVSKGMIQRATFADSARVCAALAMPQMLFQFSNISLASLRMKSVSVDGVYECQCDTGQWPLALGIILSSLPFLLALLLNVPTEGLPDVIREFDQIASSMKVFLGVISITVPTLTLISGAMTDAHAYLMVTSVLGFVLPLFYNIGWEKVYLIKTKTGNGLVRLQSFESRKTRSSSFASSKKEHDSLETIKKAEDATVMVKMFESVGRVDKALEVDADILSMFKADGEYDHDVGFTDDEIHSFGHMTLEMVVATLIKMAKHWNTRMNECEGEEKNYCISNQSKSCLDAFRIFEKAPAKHRLKD